MKNLIYMIKRKRLFKRDKTIYEFENVEEAMKFCDDLKFIHKNNRFYVKARLRTFIDIVVDAIQKTVFDFDFESFLTEDVINE